MPVCQWCLKGEVKLFTCSRCKNASYCSKECQAQHWKSGHKQDCKKHVEAITNARSRLPENESPEEFEAFCRVYKAWRDRVTLILPSLLLLKLGPEYCFSVHPPTKVVIVNLTFNANNHAFKVKGFAVAGLDLLPQVAPSIRQSYESAIQRHPSKRFHFVLTHCNKSMASMPVIVENDAVYRAQYSKHSNEEKIIKFMEECSSRRELKFKKQELALVYQKFPQQVKSLDKKAIAEWVVAALHLNTAQPMQLTHYLKVEFDFSEKLGEMGEILRYSTVTTGKMKKWLKKKQKDIDIVNSEKMDVAKYQDGKNILVPIIFTTPSNDNTISNFIFVEPLLYPKDAMMIQTSPQVSNRVAAEKFKVIQSQIKNK